MTFDLKLWPINLNINRHQIITKDNLYQIWSFWDNEFLSYPFRKVWDTNMTFDLDLNITRDQYCNKDYLPTTFKACEANRSSNLLVFLLHNARVYGQADIHTHRPTYQPTDKNVQSNYALLLRKRVKWCFNVKAGRSVYYRENRRSRLRTVGAA